MRKDKEEKGFKTEIKIQPVKFITLTDEEKKGFKGKLKHIVKVRGIRLNMMIVPVDEITTPAGIARVVRNFYGYGLFTVMGFAVYRVNRRFNPSFICIGDRCNFKKSGKCRKWKWHEKGDDCRKNSKINPNWKRICRIEIVPKEPEFWDVGELVDYNFRWFPAFSEMHKYWFWKGERGDSQQGI